MVTLHKIAGMLAVFGLLAISLLALVILAVRIVGYFCDKIGGCE